MPLSEGSRLRLAPPVTWGGRLFVPLVRTLSISHQNGGVWLSTPVALLIGERGAWWFVSSRPRDDPGVPGGAGTASCPKMSGMRLVLEYPGSASGILPDTQVLEMIPPSVIRRFFWLHPAL